jgi:hypothetical protein
MIREDRFVMSRRPYAVDLGSFQCAESVSRYPDGRTITTYRLTARAAWFRRKNRVTAACIGELWEFSGEPVSDAVAFLDQFDDGRYGGRCEGRWDGFGYWGAEDDETRTAHLEILRPMLANFPAVPEGFDGWWTFGGAR